MKGASGGKKAQVTSDWLLHSPYNLPCIFLWNKKRILLDKSQFRPRSIDTDVPPQLRFKASSLIYNLAWLYFYSSNKT